MMETFFAMKRELVNSQDIGLLTTWMFFATVNVAHHFVTFFMMVLILFARGNNLNGGESVSVGLAAALATIALACAITCVYWV